MATEVVKTRGYSYLGNAFFLKPPGLPWLMSLFVREGQFGFHLLNLIIMASAVASEMPAGESGKPAWHLWCVGEDLPPGR